MERAHLFARLRPASGVHDFKPDVKVVLVQPPSGNGDFPAFGSRDLHLRDPSPFASANDAEDRGPDDRIRSCASVVRKFGKET